jgi:hypothetical protein
MKTQVPCIQYYTLVLQVSGKTPLLLGASCGGVTWTVIEGAHSPQSGFPDRLPVFPDLATQYVHLQRLLHIMLQPTGSTEGALWTHEEGGLSLSVM